MNMSARVLDYVLSRTDNRHRHIEFYEVLRLTVALNLSADEALELLKSCNFCLNECVRDKIIFEVLSTPHRDIIEMDERLDCLLALEMNEPFNTNDYDYLTLFKYILKKNS